ncbi:hypothetical protein BDU57DRAFT_522947 [Ampelomyces quisqualis]|uniref:Uncharacterized protein n=1 Tax=Ampelomyces quisqualis TaxID=50730 RepID=A0A6A5QB31_AMPQU|nr:hypothetical protein BDU57DRAFT_522947 [Ampelomyces quisqualis]
MTEYDDYGIPQPAGAPRRPGRIARMCSVANVLAALWWAALYWGERGVFDAHMHHCRWDRWERWEGGATPHRLALVADPQLVDPHTYPGRPWPLNPLAYQYTDRYLRRTFARLQTALYPDTVFFLGDLFDGGREWATRTTRSPDAQFRRYGNDFWLREYRRFCDIFFAHWGDAGLHPRPGQPGRRIISSLPGNHDLGFARGVQVGVRNRFNAYFGDSNRIDVIANHTFVSIDSLSLSAKGQDAPEQTEDLWRPTADFLAHASSHKQRLVQRQLRIHRGLRPYPAFAHDAFALDHLAPSELPHAQDRLAEFPTILLSHIPLFRAPGTPCGPLREHWPPTPPPPGQPPLQRDDRNAISVSAGYQYQNVLTKEITVDIANKIGDIRYAFSGDDHDYCDVVHHGYASGGGGIREITVKSTSWAMGVRHPGVVLVSLWNPVDTHGNPLRGNGNATMQTHLCLFPDQIGTFIKYALLFGLTLALILLRAALITAGLVTPLAAAPARAASPILPYTTHDVHKSKQEPSLTHPTDPIHSSHSTCSSDRPGLSARPPQTRAKYSLPLVQHPGYHESRDDRGEKKARSPMRVYGGSSRAREKEKEKQKQKEPRGVGLFVYHVQWPLGKVVVLAGMWYAWLVWLDRA